MKAPGLLFWRIYHQFWANDFIPFHAYVHTYVHVHLLTHLRTYIHTYKHRVSKPPASSQPRRDARSVNNPPHPAKDGRRMGFFCTPLYSVDSSFAIGSAHSAALAPKSSSKITLGILVSKIGVLASQNRYLGVQNRFLQPPDSSLGRSWPPPSHFYGFENRFWMDFAGPGLGNRGLSMVKSNAFGQPPYALPGAEAPSKICKKPRKN